MVQINEIIEADSPEFHNELYDKNNTNQQKIVLAQSGTVLTKQKLSELCRNKKLHSYDTIELNPSINLSYCNLSDVSYINGYTQIVSLYCNNNILTSMNGIESLVKLKYLYLSHNQFTNTIFNELLQLNELCVIDLSYNSINTIDNIDQLKQCTKLTTIQLNNNTIGDITPLNKLSGMTALTSLDLSHNTLCNTTDELINTLSSVVNLHTLNISGNESLQFTYDSRQLLIAEMRSLKYFNNQSINQLERTLSTSNTSKHCQIRQQMINDRLDKEQRNIDQMRVNQQQQRDINRMNNEIQQSVNDVYHQQYSTATNNELDTDELDHELLQLIAQLNNEPVDVTNYTRSSTEHSISIHAPLLNELDHDDGDDDKDTAVYNVPDYMLVDHSASPYTVPISDSNHKQFDGDEKTDDVDNSSSYVLQYLNTGGRPQSTATNILRRALLESTNHNQIIVESISGGTNYRGSTSMNSSSMGSIRSNNNSDEDEDNI